MNDNANNYDDNSYFENGPFSYQNYANSFANCNRDSMKKRSAISGTTQYGHVWMHLCPSSVSDGTKQTLSRSWNEFIQLLRELLMTILESFACFQILSYINWVKLVSFHSVFNINFARKLLAKSKIWFILSQTNLYFIREHFIIRTRKI